MRKFEKQLLKQAKLLQKTLVFPEAAFSVRIVEACKILAKNRIAKVVLIGDESALRVRHKNLSGCVIINPKTSEHSEMLAKELYGLRKHKGMPLDEAKKLILDPFYFSTMLLHHGLVDGVVGGAETATATMLRPGLQIIKAKTEGGLISSCVVLTGKHKMLNGQPALLLADCGLNVNPNSNQLAQIAAATSQTMQQLGLAEPRIAFLSFSTFGSATSPETEKVQQAVAQTQAICPNVLVEGELQIDAALIPSVAQTKAPKSKLMGKSNVLIFPDLQSGNIAYKAMQRFGQLQAYGPIIQNFNKPINDLSRGCTINEIVITSAITALQTQDLKEKTK